MILENFEQLLRQACTQPRRTVAVAAAHDSHVLEAVADAAVRGLVDYRLVGRAEQIVSICKELNFEPEPSWIIDEAEDGACAKLAVELVRTGQAQLLMKGALTTPTLLREVVNRETGIGTGRMMSHIAMFQLPAYHKLLSVTDGGMVLAPDLDDKRAILENGVAFLHALGCQEPRVAILAPVETVNPKMPATVDADALVRQNLSGEITGCIIAGPISFDLAISRESADIKGYSSPVTAEVDLMVVPDINCGNILGKSFVYAGGAVMAGCIVGARVPIILTSRGSGAKEKLYSLAIAALAGSIN